MNALTVYRAKDIQAELRTSGERPKRGVPGAPDLLGEILKVEFSSPTERQRARSTIESLGSEAQREAARQSELLQRPLKLLLEQTADSGAVGKSLRDLRIQVEKLDPATLDASPGLIVRLLGKVPFIGGKIASYASRYESAATVIESIVSSLQRGQDRLSRDIGTLASDEQTMQMTKARLSEEIEKVQALEQQVSRKTAELGSSDTKRAFLEEEILFPLRARLMDLREQFLVAEQGILACELLIRNNRELLRGVQRAVNVTGSALRVGATVGMALASQRQVLDKIDHVSRGTSDLIASTAKQLKEQGTQIQARASRPLVDVESFRSAFADMRSAVADLSDFRRKALPEMAVTLRELDALMEEASRLRERIP